MQVTSEEIQVIARLVKDLCGVMLDQTKGYLIESRLSSVAEKAGCKSFSELYYKSRYDQNKALQEEIIDAITTQETLFFRDNSPFDALKHKALPELIDARANTPYPKRIRIWSAACSTGQEPYSIAMILRKLIPDIDSWNITITATDIADVAIAQASLGKYADHEIRRGMPPEDLQKYFIHEGNTWKVKDELRSMIKFQKLNLHQSFIGLGPFDIIFCRNVAIYFSQEARRDLFLRLSEKLTPDGYLFVGSSESLSDIGPRFAPQNHCRAVFYRPNLQVPTLAAV